MAQSTIFVGMDVHQDSVMVAVLPEGAQECEEVRKLPHDLAKIRKLFARLSKRGTVRTCYEASGCGYVLQRALAWRSGVVDRTANLAIRGRSWNRQLGRPRRVKDGSRSPPAPSLQFF